MTDMPGATGVPSLPDPPTTIMRPPTPGEELLEDVVRAALRRGTLDSRRVAAALDLPDATVRGWADEPRGLGPVREGRVAMWARAVAAGRPPYEPDRRMNPPGGRAHPPAGRAERRP